MRRLTSDCNQHIFTRSIESDEHRVKRLAHDYEQHSINREFRSEVAYENRKKVARRNYHTLRNKNDTNLGQNKKIRVEEIRRNENYMQYQESLLSDAQRHHLNRQLEIGRAHV